MKPKITFLTVLALSGTLFMQGAARAAEEPTAAEKPERPDYYPWTIGFQGGSEGLLGGFGEWRFSDHMGVRVGGAYTDWSKGGTSVAGINYDLKVTLSGAPVSFTIYPWKTSSFHFAFGWLFNGNEMTGTASDSGTITIDGQPFPTDQVGSLTMKIQQQPINPYLGIGGNFFYLDHAHHWAVGGEAGILYTGDAKVSISRTGVPRPAIDFALQGAEGRLNNYAEQFTWLPVVMLRLSYSF